MAIDIIPGVGPQNSDIAAAVNAPSAATIAAAVAAPSAATIATQVAASVPTLSQINTAVSNNASPFGGTWAQLGTYTGDNTSSTVTFSGLSSYKYLELFFIAQPGATDSFSIRFNGDSSSTNYAYSWTTAGSSGVPVSSADSIRFPGTTGTQSGVFKIYGSNNAITNKITEFAPSRLTDGTGNTRLGTMQAVWKNTSAISSITAFFPGGSVYTPGTYIVIRGAN